ncbi:FKBP-type peptidyl-prolyl cis-trans isomerase [Sandaracinobacteroides saxicola]|uniref:Peptidyl-prolyl cis-trans isomerase n=1 Tax=Sandaracinobacteroides saxicola TaxID=2759707 RepID=A0A7G5IJU4_9SPHN|nr:FKBP-type peptidyl-prolyl cis-trans isomerase [Sandaracinobacteroides saxicola]QMW23636.1 FKBP-type peptidyl-prolyl cis-trans isomerase [Sandaracinobacteroides saxicola]
MADAKAGAGGGARKAGNGLAKWVIVGTVALGVVAAVAWAGTAKLVGPANEAKAFMESHASKAGVKSTDSGLHYEVVAEGTGPKPTAADTVLVHYEGRLTDGTVFDSSVARGQPAAFGVADVIPGWTEGLQLMNTGAKYRFTIPPQLGYGAAGAGGVIPPNAVLVFDVQLLAIAPKQ